MAAPKSPGMLVANLLFQSWRGSTDKSDISSDELIRITSLLLGSGAGALASFKVRNSDLRKSPSAVEFQQAYRVHTLHASVFEDDIKQVMMLLRRAGVDPILIKGWAAARLYPDPGLRPYGDIDLCILPEQYKTALAACSSDEGKRFVVDLHSGLDISDGPSIEDLYARSQLVKLGDVDIRVPSLEDHIRLLSLHLLKHGAWRPLWLCDIGVAIEKRTSDFDWKVCLGNDRRRADWITCCIGLAHQLLGAEMDDTPIAKRAKNLPSWLVPEVLKQWEKPYASAQAPVTHQAPMSKYLRNPRGLFADLRRRWPKPIAATVYVGGPFNELPRWPFQVGECVARTAKFLARLPKQLRDNR